MVLQGKSQWVEDAMAQRSDFLIELVVNGGQTIELPTQGRE